MTPGVTRPVSSAGERRHGTTGAARPPRQLGAATRRALPPGDLKGRRVTVMGLGRFGGGAGVARWLADQGADVLVTDLQPAHKLGPSLDSIGDHVSAGRIALRLGGHDPQDFLGAEVVVVSPAVPRPWENSLLRAATAAGARVTTEIRLLVERLDRRQVIGVTGSAGKSTTAAMVHHVLCRGGATAHLGGNIGGSLLGDLSRIGPDDRVVLELSSAMLWWLCGEGRPDRGPGWSPSVALLTNIEPNHIDWHGSFEHYRRCKEAIFAHQVAGEAALRGESLPEARPVALRVPGIHNQRNARLAAAAASCACGIDPADAESLLEDFRGLPHRLQLLAEHDGKRFYDDSKSTTPAATLLAVESLGDPGRIHLIAGGYDKGADLGAVARLAGSLAGLYTIGATGPALAAAAGGHAAARCCGTLRAAVDDALRSMRRGDVLLLSPACASWDQFESYHHRGLAFGELLCRRGLLPTLPGPQR